MRSNVATRTHLLPTYGCAQRTCLTSADQEFRNQPMRLFQPMRSTSKVSSLKFSPHAAMGTPICRLYQLNLVNLTVHIPRRGRRRVPFSTRNSQATLNRHNNLTGPFIHSPMDIFHQQYSLTACRFIFVLHATGMSWDNLSFTNSPP